SHLKDLERVQYKSITDDEAIEAVSLLTKMEGIIPALETAHAVAYLNKLMPKTSKEDIIIVNISGRGDKDLATLISKINVD
ncbi:MAG: tryptophan synthase subunit beta, partial [Ignavibacteria bacterium]|nr:tryptophan synthase subunit beta [Ignavibacteria bacterium]